MKSFSLLILEDDVRVSEMIRSHLQSTMPQVTVMLARTIAEAHVFIYQYEFSAFLIDIALPDGNGLEFTVDLQTVLPDARILIITGIPYVEIEPQLQQMTTFKVVQKPFDMLNLERDIRQMIPDLEEKPQFQGSLRQLRLVDLIQIKCLSFDSCKLILSGPGGAKGVVVIDGGAILHAKTDHLKSNEALNEILSWKGGVFQEEEFRGDVEADIEGRWEMVLMEAVRLSDECHAMQAA
jgi:ActR/RegA family two-component response regulator